MGNLFSLYRLLNSFLISYNIYVTAISKKHTLEFSGSKQTVRGNNYLRSSVLKLRCFVASPQDAPKHCFTWFLTVFIFVRCLAH